MKELNNTKRISVSVVGYLAIILIGILSFSKSTLFFTKDGSSVIEEIENLEYEVFPDEALEYIANADPTILFVDVRNEYEFTKNHLEGAINIPKEQLLEESHLDILNQALKDSTTVILYGKDQLEANGVWMILYQMGYTNTKVLLGGYQVISAPDFDADKTSLYFVEESNMDFQRVVLDAQEKMNVVEIKEVKKQVQIIPVKRIENDIDEGGC